MTTSAARPTATSQEFTFAARPEELAAARRRFLELAAAHVEEERLGSLQLIISEVMTNAVRHGPDDGGEVLVRVTPKDDYLCVQVTDEGAGFAPRPRAYAPTENGGYGLFLIEQLTRRWGLTREGARTRVWFEFDSRA